MGLMGTSRALSHKIGVCFSNDSCFTLKGMHDPRFDKLAKLLTGFSTALRRGDKVLLEGFDIPASMMVALIRAVRVLGAVPFVQIHQAQIGREMVRGADEAQYDLIARHELARMKQMDAYIAIRGGQNIAEMSDVPSDRLKLVSRKMKPVLDHRVGKTRWVILRWPSPSMAQQAGMSTEAFENFFFDVCTLDYGKMQPGMKALAALMEKTDRVEIKGPGTDLRFSIKGIPAIPCGGRHNIPDGEKWIWTPAQPDRQAKRQMIALQQLPELLRRVKELEKLLAQKAEPAPPAEPARPK